MRIMLMAGVIALFGIACTGSDSGAPDDTASLSSSGIGDSAMAPGAEGVTVALRDSAGRELGTLTLRDDTGGVAVSGRLRDLPQGSHAIHLHETGRCEPPFESAGGHWNPTNRQHGAENPQGPHFGDLPNLTVDADGSVAVQATTPGGTLRGANALFDADSAAIVIHAQPDDNRTDPAGGAGNRIACGVVSVS